MAFAVLHMLGKQPVEKDFFMSSDRIIQFYLWLSEEFLLVYCLPHTFTTL